MNDVTTSSGDAAAPRDPRLRARRPYADAPRLPEGDSVDLRSLVAGKWIELEIGPGRGVFVFERLAAEPELGFVGFEVRRKWAAIVDARLAKQGHAARARVFAEDAKVALGRVGPDGVVRRVFVHFPDPWWKKRHQKRKVLGQPLLEQIARLLEPGGELFVQTDVETRAEELERIACDVLALEPAGSEPGSPWMNDNPYRAESPREKRANADGLPVYRLRYRRR